MMEKKLQELCGKSIEACSYEELYAALMTIVKEKSREKILPAEGRKLYYISAEFLIGKLLSNNLINLGLYEEADQCLQAHGKSMAELEEAEPEPSLGNGGLGRLAACFLDSLATLNLPGDGIGLRYHCGLFHQYFRKNIQTEEPDFWLSADTWTEDTGNYATENTPTRSEILSEYGFDWGDMYYVYCTPLDETLRLQLWFDPETGKGCGFRYVWEAAPINVYTNRILVNSGNIVCRNIWWLVRKKFWHNEPEKSW